MDKYQVAVIDMLGLSVVLSVMMALMLTFFVFLRFVYTKLPVSLDCRFLMVPSVFSNVYETESML
jgi:hypothetical protein